MVNILTFTTTHFINLIILGALILELLRALLKNKIFTTPVFIILILIGPIEVLMNMILQIYPLTALLTVYVIFYKKTFLR